CVAGRPAAGRPPRLFAGRDPALAGGLPEALLLEPVQALDAAQRPKDVVRRIAVAARRLAPTLRRALEGLARRAGGQRSGRLGPAAPWILPRFSAGESHMNIAATSRSIFAPPKPGLACPASRCDSALFSFWIRHLQAQGSGEFPYAIALRFSGGGDRRRRW